MMYAPLWFRILLASPFAFKSKFLIGVWGRGIWDISVSWRGKRDVPKNRKDTPALVILYSPPNTYYPHPWTKVSHLYGGKPALQHTEKRYQPDLGDIRQIRRVHSHWFDQLERTKPLVWWRTSTLVYMYHKFQQQRNQGIYALRRWHWNSQVFVGTYVWCREVADSKTRKSITY